MGLSQVGAAHKRSKYGGSCAPGALLFTQPPQLTSDRSVFLGSLSAMAGVRTTCLQCRDGTGFHVAGRAAAPAAAWAGGGAGSCLDKQRRYRSKPRTPHPHRAHLYS